MARSKSVHILFIGNSFTQRNDLPGIITEMCAERGVRVQHKLLSVGGASLRTHWNAGRAQKEIASGKYDYVVLQEQSTLPVKNPARMAENIRLFDAAIRDAGAKTVLYLTWARKHSLTSQAAISKAYSSIGKELNAIVVPVGTLWKKLATKRGVPDLYDRDQSHPSPAGTYFAACMFLKVLLSLDPVGVKAHADFLSDSAAKLLQTVARKGPR